MRAGSIALAMALVPAAASADCPEGGWPAAGSLAAAEGGLLILSQDAAALATGDFDGDGARELAAALPGGGVILRRGGADGPAAPAVADLDPCALAALDADGDARDELAIGLPGGGVASLDLLSGEPRLLGPWRAAALAAADLDVDGRGDLLVALAEGGVLAVFGGSELEVPLSPARAARLAAGDFLGRGRPQVALGLPSGGIELIDPIDPRQPPVPLASPAVAALAAVAAGGEGGSDELAALDRTGLLLRFGGIGAGRAEVTVVVDPAVAGAPLGDGLLAIEPPSGPPPDAFIRGDGDLDGAVGLNDAIVILLHLFREGEAPACLDRLDVNDDGAIDVSDPLYALLHLFGGLPPPPPPSGSPGTDPTPDELPCGG